MPELESRVSRGLAWPLRIDERGCLDFDVGCAEIDRSIYAILSTAPGERLMHPEFGCRVWAHMTGANDPGFATRGVEMVRDALTRWESRIEVQDLTVTARRINSADDDPTPAIAVLTGNHIPADVVDVHVAYVERATTEHRTIRIRLMITDEPAFVLQQNATWDLITKKERAAR